MNTPLFVFCFYNLGFGLKQPLCFLSTSFFLFRDFGRFFCFGLLVGCEMHQHTHTKKGKQYRPSDAVRRLLAVIALLPDTPTFAFQQAHPPLSFYRPMSYNPQAEKKVLA